jgi:hypothetical protein
LVCDESFAALAENTVGFYNVTIPSKPQMPGVPRAAFFDVDGVLIDSLPEHLKICRDKAIEYGLNLKIPAANEFRQLVAQGTRLRTMRPDRFAVANRAGCVGAQHGDATNFKALQQIAGPFLSRPVGLGGRRR